MRFAQKTFLVSLFSVLLSHAAFSGTIILKDGTKMSGVKIVNILDGRIQIEKDKTTKTISLGEIKEYYDTDVKGIDTSVPGTFADYTLSLQIKMPDKGECTTTSSGGEKKKETEDCELTYILQRKNLEAKKALWPYFYLYVLVPGDSETKPRKILRYCYPDEAKPKGKGSYNRAAIMELLSAFNRPIIYFEHNYDGVGEFKAGKTMGDAVKNSRTAKIPLSSVGQKNILAWYVEVWGHEDIVFKKDHVNSGVKVDKNWWERYGN